MAARFLIVLFLVLASGCSRIKTAYTWLDWVLERQASQYLDLTREQSDAAEVAIDSYLAWHRSVMLPRYVRFLRIQAVSLRLAPMTRGSFAVSDRELRALYEQTMEGVVQLMADLLADQSPSQLNHLDDALADRQAELREDASDEDRIEERQEDFEELFEDLVGELTPAQRAALAERVRALHGDPGPWLTERARRNAAILARLRAGAGRDEVAGLLGTWWMGQPDPQAPPEYEAYRQRFSDGMKALIFELLGSLDREQRAHLVRRLEAYARDFDELSRTG